MYVLESNSLIIHVNLIRERALLAFCNLDMGGTLPVLFKHQVHISRSVDEAFAGVAKHKQ